MWRFKDSDTFTQSLTFNRKEECLLLASTSVLTCLGRDTLCYPPGQSLCGSSSIKFPGRLFSRYQLWTGTMTEGQSAPQLLAGLWRSHFSVWWIISDLIFKGTHRKKQTATDLLTLITSSRNPYPLCSVDMYCVSFLINYINILDTPTKPPLHTSPNTDATLW